MSELEDQGHLFADLRLNGKPLNECELALECNQNNYRLYVDREDCCFYSLAVEFVSCAGSSSSNIWQCPELRVEPLFNTTAYHDGVRHLEFNREAGDMAGYIYYPDIQGIIDLFTKLREIEIEVCKNM